MYAVIRTGGKQYKVSPGDRIQVEKLGEAEASLTPLLVVDGTTVTTEAGALAGLPVAVTVVGAGRGKKIVAGKYKNKSRYRRRWGHRQDFSLIEVHSIGGITAEAVAEALPAEEGDVDNTNVEVAESSESAVAAESAESPEAVAERIEDESEVDDVQD